MLAGAVAGLVALAALFVFRETPADDEPSAAEEHHEDDPSPDNRTAAREPSPPAKPGEAPAQPVLDPITGTDAGARGEVRRRLLESDDEDPSTWPLLPSDYIRSEMIRDLGPLVGECMCEVHPSEDEVAVALAFTLISAPEIGGVIEAVEPREGNQAAGRLLDCIRESAFSMALPPASSRGTIEVSLHASNRQCADYLAQVANAAGG
jgi:hypothetical protein